MKSKHRWQIAVKYLSTLLGGVLAVFLLLFFIMFITGVFSKFLFWTFTYSSKYISIIPLSQAWNQFKFGFMPLYATAPLVYIISSLGLVLLFIKKISQNMRVFVLLFGLFSFLSICPGFYFRPHYFVLFIPFIAILSATFVHFMINFGQSYNKVTYSVISILLLVMIIGQPIYYQYDYFFKMNHLQISRATYWLNPFHESLEIAAFIRQNSTDTDRIAILGSEPQIFFYSHRRSISPYIYMYPLMEEHDFALEMQKEFVHDLESKASRYIIYVHVPTSWLVQLNSQRLIFNWLDNFVKKEGVALVGLVELYDDHSLFFWREKTKWPPSTEHWVAIFEKI